MQVKLVWCDQRALIQDEGWLLYAWIGLWRDDSEVLLVNRHRDSGVFPVTDHWTQLPEPLTLPQQFRLIDIAHETTDPMVKRAALDLLAQAMAPIWLAEFAALTAAPVNHDLPSAAIRP